MDLIAMEDWEFGAIGIANPKYSTLRRYFELIPETVDVPGHIAEFGVAQGNSLVTSGLILKNLASDKNVLGFDTFSGFPNYSNEDVIENFNFLADRKCITQTHFDKVQKNLNYIRARGSNLGVNEISNSGNFSNTSITLVKNKIEFFDLNDKIKVFSGDFTNNLASKIQDLTFSLILIDSDLYESYAKILPIVWCKLNPGGYIYLDEYYSLKFPGPRIAVDKFVKEFEAKLIRLDDWLDFERWALHKEL
jgi:hypothetical protein